MRASRRYFSAIMAAAVTLCTFLGTFIILALVLGSAVVGPQFLTTAAHTSCSSFALVEPGIPCPKTALHLFKLTLVLGAISLGCLFFGCIPVLFTIGKALSVAELESDSVRDNLVKNRNGLYNMHMGYAEVISPTLLFWLGIGFTAVGVCFVLAAVCTAVASSVTHQDWCFKWVVTVLVFSAVVGSLVLLLLFLTRREAVIAPAEYVQYNAAGAPVIGGAPILNSAPAAP